MNYAEQKRAFRSALQPWAFVFLLYTVLAASLVMSAGSPYGWLTVAMGLLFVVATDYAAYYLPLYLGLTIETRKRYVWPVKFRTVASPVLALLVTPALTDSGRWLAWGACVLVAAVGILAARRALRRNREAAAVPLLPLELLVGDLAILLIAASQAPGAFAPCITGMSLALTLFLVSSEGRTRGIGLLAATAALACVPGIGDFWKVAVQSILIQVAAAGGTLVLVAAAARQHRLNVEATIEDLTAFAMVTPEYAEDMLATATGLLARSWNENPPATPEAVARWYASNSEYYLYDLAQFHLAYKHIRFMIDVAGLARGRTLDYGAGIGDLALDLARAGHDVTYLDVDGRTKAFARWRAERDWLPVAFATELDEVQGPFDTIISLDVFEHLADPLPVVDGLVALLAPGGRMIVTAYFGATKSHPMHFDHDIDLGAYLRTSGLRDAKTFAMKYLRSEFLRKGGVLVFEKPDRPD